jgi:hypothetical protein
MVLVGNVRDTVEVDGQAESCLAFGKIRARFSSLFRASKQHAQDFVHYRDTDIGRKQ